MVRRGSGRGNCQFPVPGCPLVAAVLSPHTRGQRLGSLFSLHDPLPAPGAPFSSTSWCPVRWKERWFREYHIWMAGVGGEGRGAGGREGTGQAGDSPGLQTWAAVLGPTGAAGGVTFPLGVSAMGRV